MSENAVTIHWKPSGLRGYRAVIDGRECVVKRHKKYWGLSVDGGWVAGGPDVDGLKMVAEAMPGHGWDAGAALAALSAGITREDRAVAAIDRMLK